MRTKLLFILTTLFFAFGVSITTRAEVIDSFSGKYVIQKDGLVKVTERIAYDFSLFQRHGIIRKIPFVKKNSEGKEFKLGIQVQGVSDDRGNPYSYSVSFGSGLMQIKIGDANKLISGKHIYVITYIVDGGLTYFSDHDEFYWNVTGNEWTIPITRAESSIELPPGVPGTDIKIACYTGLEGSTQQDCAFTNTNGILISAQSSLSASAGLTQVIGFPKGFVAVREPQKYTRFEDTLLGKILGFIIVIIAFLWYIVLPFYIPLKWYLTGRDPKADAARVWYDPPKDKQNRSLTPAETGSLVDETVDSRDIFGSLIQLAQRGYLQIVEKKKGDFSFIKKKGWDQDTELLSFETSLLHGVFKAKNEVRVKETELSSQMNTVSNKLYDQIVTDGFFNKNPQTTRTIYYVLASVALFTGNILLAIVMFIFGKNMPKKTLLGAQQAGIGRALRTFLSSQERQLTFQAKNQMMFEKLLPYAIVFGVERVWADRFKDIPMTQPDWYTGYSNSAFNAALFSSSLHSSMSSFRSAMTPTRSSSGFSSGFSGGGFSGGGGGGGGGGSW